MVSRIYMLTRSDEGEKTFYLNYTEHYRHHRDTDRDTNHIWVLPLRSRASGLCYLNPDWDTDRDTDHIWVLLLKSRALWFCYLNSDQDTFRDIDHIWILLLRSRAFQFCYLMNLNPDWDTDQRNEAFDTRSMLRQEEEH